MAKAHWDLKNERYYYTGVRHVMLFPQSADGTYPLGVPWSGVTEISESPEGGEASPIYADDIMYANPRSAEQTAGTITCYDYPPEFSKCNGQLTAGTNGFISIGQQQRMPFAFTHETRVGNNTRGTDYGYVLKIVYNATVNPSDSTHSTINEDIEFEELSFDYSCTSIDMPFGIKPASTIELDTTTMTDAELTKFQDLLDIIYGTDNTDPRLPLPSEVFSTLGITAVNN